MNLTTCPECETVFKGKTCVCGYTAAQAARERSYSRAPCDFCQAPWEAQWVDFAAGGIRFVCRVHGDPENWLAGVRPRYVGAAPLLEATAKETGVQVQMGELGIEKTTFYRGRPSRGAKLKPVLTVINTRSSLYLENEPFKRDEFGVSLYAKMGLHRISRILNPPPYVPPGATKKEADGR